MQLSIDFDIPIMTMCSICSDVYDSSTHLFSRIALQLALCFFQWLFWLFKNMQCCIWRSEQIRTHWLRVCIYVEYACMYVCMCEYICICMYICPDSMYVRMSRRIYPLAPDISHSHYTCIVSCACVSFCAFVSARLYTYTYTYEYTYAHHSREQYVAWRQRLQRFTFSPGSCFWHTQHLYVLGSSSVARFWAWDWNSRRGSG